MSLDASVETAADLLVVPDLNCERCGRPCGLRVQTVKGNLCGRCWHAMGQPGPPQASPKDIHEAEVVTRKRMTARKGEDGYRVRAGMS